MDGDYFFTWPKLLILTFSALFTGVYLVTSTPFLVLFRPDFDTTLSAEHKAFVYEKMIEAFRKKERSSPKPSPYYMKRPETQHVDCGRVLRGEKEYIQTLAGSSRIPLIPDPFLNMTCSAITGRIENSNFKRLRLGGVAFARIVYKDYEFIEKQVQVSYHPQNVFCFTVDQKAPEEFHEKMRRLGQCMENVIVLPATESYDSNGHNNNLGHYRCMHALISRPGWSYLMLLQNYDVITKSVYELDTIFGWLGGANDIATSEETPGRRKKNLRWDPKSLRLFRDESKINETILNSEMKISSGYVQGSVSRGAVEWMIKEADLTVLIDQWNQTKYGGDEQFLASLQVNSDYGMPGHFTDECIHEHVAEITRFTRWASDGTNSCATKTVRNEICVFGIEDLRAMAAMTTLMFNKVIPSFDYSIVDCVAELLYNRTFLGQEDIALDREYYENLVTVQYHKYHNQPGFELNCTSDYGNRNYEDYL